MFNLTNFRFLLSHSNNNDKLLLIFSTEKIGKQYSKGLRDRAESKVYTCKCKYNKTKKNRSCNWWLRKKAIKNINIEINALTCKEGSDKHTTTTRTTITASPSPDWVSIQTFNLPSCIGHCFFYV